jgi:hypothetical protein
MLAAAAMVTASGNDAASAQSAQTVSWKTCMAKSMFEIFGDPSCKTLMSAMKLTRGDVAKLKGCQSMGAEARAKDSHCMQIVADHPGSLPD